MNKANVNAAITNAEILKLAKSAPEYQSWTAKYGKEKLETVGYESYDQLDGTLKGDFLNLIVQAYLLAIRGPEVRVPNYLDNIVQHFGNPYGGQARKIRTPLLKPTDPKYRNLTNNGSVDPFVIRMVAPTEEYYKQNWDYANNLSMSDTDIKKMFDGPNGIQQTVGLILGQLGEAKNIQEFELLKELFSKILSDTTRNPLKATQKIEIDEVTNSSTPTQMAQFLQVFQNFKVLMENVCYSGDFNCRGYKHGMDPSKYTLYVRAEIMNIIKTTLLATSYHTENLAIPFNVVPVKDFGGITYKDGSTAVLPCYSTGAGNKGEVLGYNATGDPTQTMKQPEELTQVDPHAKVDAVLIENGALFTTEQNPYRVDAIYNPAGNYTNFWAKQPNNMIAYDGSYDVIKFYHA